VQLAVLRRQQAAAVAAVREMEDLKSGTNYAESAAVKLDYPEIRSTNSQWAIPQLRFVLSIMR
jgi:hypothetical protein